MQQFANPTRFLRLANRALSYIWALTIILFAIGLYGALVSAPPDYQQGETARIMYVHVPAAWVAMFCYALMAMASALAIIYRHPLADVAAKTAAPIGAVFCFLNLATGALWGKPMWGTWWEWDPRLTAMFVQMLLYVGYIAIWQAIEEPGLAARIARIVALVGSINIVIVKYSVEWWNSLHQPASVTKMAIDKSMLWPLLVMGLAYTFLFLALHLMSMRSEITARKLRNLQIARSGEA